MNGLRPRYVLAALTLWVSGGCADLPVVAPVADGSPLNAKAGRPPQQQIWTSDDEYARVARAEVPGFAGYYIEKDGTPVILLKDHRQREAAERYLAPKLARARVGRNGGGGRKPVVRKVAHDFADLKGWFDEIYRLMPREDVYMLDVDEVGNRVTIGVRDAAAIKAVRREVARVGVPPGVVNLRIESAGELRIGLQDKTSTLAGGFQVAGRPNSRNSGICTLGFNALFYGIKIFVTNSHCTFNSFAYDGDTWMQPTFSAGNEIGAEIADKAMYDCPGVGTYCRMSDAAYIQNTSTRNVGQGKIAFTELGHNAPAPGGPNYTVIGYYDIIGRYTPSVGDYLDKTGRTTGSTYGRVEEVCALRWAEGDRNKEIWCTDVSTVYSTGGDSGSPIYLYWENNTVLLVGVTFGGPAGEPYVTWSSRLAGIEQDLGPLTNLCAPGYGC